MLPPLFQNKKHTAVVLSVGFVVFSFLVVLQGRLFCFSPSVSRYFMSMPTDTSHDSIGLIMEWTGTDKSYRHAYDRYYELYFRDFRHMKGVKILEIGASTGRSMQLWAGYFSEPAAIHGVAYGEDTKKIDQKQAVCDWNPAVCDKMTIFKGDQSDPVFLKSITDKYKYDIIIDDGSHVPSHQIISLKYLFSALNPGGLYIIEDLETSYWADANLYGYQISAGIAASPKVSAVEKLKQFIDVMMRFEMAHADLHIFPEDSKFFSVTFGQGLAIIRKSTEADMQHQPFTSQAPVNHLGINEWGARAMESNP
jgi:cephalosporin hydroxylase